MADKRSKQSLDEQEEQQLREDVVGGGDEEAVGQLSERVVDGLHISSDLRTNSASTAAMNGSGRNGVVHGLPRNDFFNSARALEPADAGSVSWEDKIKELLQEGPQHLRCAASSGSVPSASDSHDDDQVQCSLDSSEKPPTAGVREEDDWEAVVDLSPTPPKTSSPSVGKELNSNEKRAIKQRGRGSFTYGGLGLYSELEMDADKDGPGSSCSVSDHSIDGEAGHVLVLTCSSKTKTKDLEDIVEPFSKEGSCAVRWVDNTRALAVFSSPTMAKEALVGIDDERVKVSMFSESSGIPGSQLSMNDVAPSVPRPASSAKVAQRMIASALSRQGVSKQLLARNQESSQEIQKQERERKLRLQARAQLRDEAWGSDDD